MGVRLLVEVLDRAPADLTPAERLVLAVLAEDARDDTRTCWPGMEKLTRRTGLKPDSLRRVFQRLAKRGIEVRVPIKFTDKGAPVFAREGVQTNYRIPALPEMRRDAGPPFNEGEPEGRRDADPPSEAGQESRQSGGEAGCSSQRGGTVVPLRRDEGPAQEAGPSSRPSPQSPSGSPQDSPHNAREARAGGGGGSGQLFDIEDTHQADDGSDKTAAKKPEPGSDADPEFTEWWKHVPKKEDKGAARKAWKKARKAATFEQLLDGIKSYAAHDPRVARGFIKNPATWLNGECWLNEYTQQPQAANGGHQPYRNPTDASAYTEEW